jgi:biopolymer transport protein ExbB/TolQ
MDEITTGTMATALVALLGKEILAYLRSRKGAKANGGDNPGHGKKLDRMAETLEEIRDTVKRNGKELAAISEATARTERATARFEETQGRTERAMREAVRVAKESQ